MRAPWVLPITIGAIVSTTGCGDERRALSVSPTCTFSVTLTTSVFNVTGGASTATVKAPAGCTWAATTAADWITINAGASGSGDGTVAFTAASYDGRAPRTGTLVIAEHTLTVTQNACTLRLQPAELTIGDPGGRAEVAIETEEPCQWTAESAARWVSIEPAAGRGPARATLRIEENPGAAREAILHVNAQPLRIRQAAEPQRSCTYKIDPVRSIFPMRGGSGIISVSTAPGCAWTARTPRDFPILRHAGSGTGSGSVAFDVPVKSGGRHLDRGAIEFRWAGPSAGENAWIGQTGDCEVQFPPPVEWTGSTYVLSFTAAGGTQRIQVWTEPPGTCEWRIEGMPAWLNAAYFGRSAAEPFSDLLRFGSGSLNLTAAPNPSAAPRTVTIKISETSLTVTQAGR